MWFPRGHTVINAYGFQDIDNKDNSLNTKNMQSEQALQCISRENHSCEELHLDAKHLIILDNLSFLSEILINSKLYNQLIYSFSK